MRFPVILITADSFQNSSQTTFLLDCTDFFSQKQRRRKKLQSNLEERKKKTLLNKVFQVGWLRAKFNTSCMAVGAPSQLLHGTEFPLSPITPHRATHNAPYYPVPTLPRVLSLQRSPNHPASSSALLLPHTCPSILTSIFICKDFLTPLPIQKELILDLHPHHQHSFPAQHDSPSTPAAGIPAEEGINNWFFRI